MAYSPGMKATSEVHVRELPGEEFHLLAQFSPFNEIGPPNPSLTRAIVIEDIASGQIQGFVFLSYHLHVEPYWVDPSLRKRPGVIRRVWRKVRELMFNASEPLAFTTINYEDMPRGILSQATGLGFRRVPGDLFLLNSEDMPKWTQAQVEPTKADQVIKRVYDPEEEANVS